jgi:hypothetical protein
MQDEKRMARASTAIGIILLVLVELFAMWHQITAGLNCPTRNRRAGGGLGGQATVLPHVVNLPVVREGAGLSD